MRFTHYRPFSLLLFLAFIIICCKKDSPSVPPDVDPDVKGPAVLPDLTKVRSFLVDKNATEETAWLFYNLQSIAKTNILFGHQDATKRGVVNASTSWANEQHLPAVSKDKSDVKEVTGAYPAVYGHDFMYVTGFVEGNWFDHERRIAKELTIEAFNRGGINTYAWHYSNPVSKGSFYWKDSPVDAVGQILPGGSHNDTFKQSLKQIADFAQSLIGADGKLVPVIFRPFHEMDGSWFWWGKGHCTPAQYKDLYRYTVTYLKNDLGVRNFLYCWSPGGEYTSLTQYLEYYPGDEYVDIVGTDNYSLNADASIQVISNKLKIAADYAKQKNKVAAFTETGQQNLTVTNWYSQKLLGSLQSQKIDLAYVLVWANTKDAFWTPYKGHPAENDFKLFKNAHYVMFADELKRNMYKQH